MSSPRSFLSEKTMFERMSDASRVWVMDAWGRMENDSRYNLTCNDMVESTLALAWLRDRLLGLLRALDVKGIDLDRAYDRAKRDEVEAMRHELPGFKPQPLPPFIPIARDAWQTFRCAEREAHALLHSEIVPEHLLLGLLQHASGVAGNLLDGFGLELKSMRAYVSGLAPVDANTQTLDEGVLHATQYSLAMGKLSELAYRVGVLRTSLDKLRTEVSAS